MEDKIVIRGRLISKSSVLNKPDFFKDTPMLVFLLPEVYQQPFMKYFKEHGMKENMELQIAPWPLEPTERAKKFFFTLRDRVAEAQGDSSRENKDMLYRSAVKELGLRKGNTIINSLKDLDRTGLFMATEIMHAWAIEAEAYITDLIPEMKASQKGLKE